jgi:hypothetical protein
MTSLLNFIKIYQLVQKLLGGDPQTDRRRTDRQTGDVTSLTFLFEESEAKNRCTRNITHYKESATIRNLKPEWWSSPLIREEKYQEKTVRREEK